jgi:hypothetical protein
MKFATKPRRSSQQQHRANEGGQRRRRGDQPARIAVGHRQAQLGARQDGQRGGGTDAEHAGGAEQRIDQHRDEGRVQADGHRQTGHGGIGHRLGQNDRGSRQSGHHIKAQCLFAD